MRFRVRGRKKGEIEAVLSEAQIGLVDRFVLLIEGAMPENTVRSTRKVLRMWLTWNNVVGEEGVNATSVAGQYVEVESLLRFLEWLYAGGKSRATLEQYRALLNVYSVHNNGLNILEGFKGEDMLRWKRLVRRSAQGREVKRASPLSLDELREMLDVARGPTRIRDRAMLMLMYMTGMRGSEVARLRPEDVTIMSDCVRVRILGAKGDRAMTGQFVNGADLPGEIELTDTMKVWKNERLRRMEAYARGRSAGGRSAVDFEEWGIYLFFLTESSKINDVIKRLSRRAGFTNKITSHSFRAGLATEAYSRGIEIGVIAKQLRHKDPATTLLYVRPTDMENTAKRIAEALGDGKFGRDPKKPVTRYVELIKKQNIVQSKRMIAMLKDQVDDEQFPEGDLLTVGERFEVRLRNFIHEAHTNKLNIDEFYGAITGEREEDNQ